MSTTFRSGEFSPAALAPKIVSFLAPGANTPPQGAALAIRARGALAAALLAGAILTGATGVAPGGALAREIVAFPQTFRPGMIVIRQSERRLYLVTGVGAAIRYPVAIGRAGKAWQGEAYIQGKYLRPAWSAPADVLHDHPSMPRFIPGGSPHNPMGAAALMLSRDEVAIHGTSASMRKSIGSAVSYGCIRMLNEDIVDLYGRVRVGTPVVAVP
jgi:lipoprotein-anchoring transpeptidase ErfK/SrfK